MGKFDFSDQFVNRHNGPRPEDVQEMLKVVDVNSLDELIEKTVPSKIRLEKEMELDEAVTEHEFLTHLRSIASKNKIYKTYIGMGYYPTITPSVIIRNILQNPGWYTQYTPYQAEISQGRLAALLNFQTMLSDLTALPLANASLLDEATAAAEAMGMFYASRKRAKKNSNVFFVSDECLPQTIDVLKTRAYTLGIELRIGNYKELELTEDIFGILVQYPSADGAIYDYTELFEKAAEMGIFKCVAADLLSLAILTPPGEFGADCVVGSTQRFGVPMGYGGPHAGYFVTKEDFKRQIPGRIIGTSIDGDGKPALRMALQTREQHIKREKATSNICTAQVLLAIMAGMYAVYHGPKGIKAIAQKTHNLTLAFAEGVQKLGLEQQNQFFFDTVKVKIDSAKVNELALQKEINIRVINSEYVGVSFAENNNINDVNELLAVFAEAAGKDAVTVNDCTETLPECCIRKSEYMTHPVFNSYHSETEMMRYIKKLESRDLSLTSSMIPLGSCTMKLNAATEMLGIDWPEFAQLHPFIPADQAAGYRELFTELEKQLCVITGFSGCSLQPNSGANGEYAGLLVIKKYHEDRGDGHRNIVIIPSSAHGTNPASAIMAGGKIVIVKCDDHGNIDVEDLRAKAEEHKDNLSSLMITYPSTHGVFEESIMEICEIIHKNGGQVYMDGANMNAQVGLTSPYNIGADVCHLNLHKTFAIPHGGGGPGVGPICVAEHLVPFLPGHAVVNIGSEKAATAVSAAPWGSANVTLITYAYIKMMGAEGLTEATKIAMLNANYLRAKLAEHYEILYTGSNGMCAHEMIVDMREFKASAGIEVEDIAKRLMDFSYHAPTVAFPVPGTLMVEPTESESKAELDKFIEAMAAIRAEIAEIENGQAEKENNILKNAPHTAQVCAAEEWNKPYPREKAGYPVEYLRDSKFWPFVGRVDNAYGDRNLVCSCLPVEAYQDA
ncbi:MAG: aminomethyl-transferring glycine dehydrogenase [Rhodothermaceae bacterium]